MTGKIFRSTLAASLTVLLASLLVITGCLYTYFGTVREQQLQTELTLAAAAVEADGAGHPGRGPGTAGGRPPARGAAGGPRPGRLPPPPPPPPLWPGCGRCRSNRSRESFS